MDLLDDEGEKVAFLISPIGPNGGAYPSMWKKNNRKMVPEMCKSKYTK